MVTVLSFGPVAQWLSGRVLDLRSRQVEGDLIHGDMGYGIPFRPGTFDGIIRYCNWFII